MCCLGPHAFYGPVALVLMPQDLIALFLGLLLCWGLMPVGLLPGSSCLVLLPSWGLMASCLRISFPSRGGSRFFEYQVINLFSLVTGKFWYQGVLDPRKMHFPAFSRQVLIQKSELPNGRNREIIGKSDRLKSQNRVIIGKSETCKNRNWNNIGK